MQEFEPQRALIRRRGRFACSRGQCRMRGHLLGGPAQRVETGNGVAHELRRPADEDPGNRRPDQADLQIDDHPARPPRGNMQRARGG